MDFSFIKQLLETPNKLGKFAIAASKISINLIVSRWLYVHLFGAYNLAGIKEWQSWLEFIFTGPFLYWIFVYIISELALFQLLPGCSFFLFHALSRWTANKKLGKTEGMQLLRWFSYMGLFRYDKKTKRVKAGAKTDDLYAYIEKFTAKEAGNEISALKQSFIQDIWNIYLAFVIIYLTILPAHYQTPRLNTAIVTGCFVLLVVYAGLAWMLDVLHTHAGEILFSLGGIRMERTALEVIRKAGNYIVERTDIQPDKTFDTFYFRGKQHIIHWYHTPRTVPDFIIERYARIQDQEKCYLLIANKGFSVKAIALASTCDSLHVICYADETDLLAQLNAYLSEEKDVTRIMTTTHAD